jgi:hypothetical protein
MRFLSFTYTSVQPFLYDGVRSFDRWISRSVLLFGFSYSLLIKLDQGIIMFLQSLPTQDWGDHEVELLLSEAFVLNSIWHNAQSHFGATK